MVYEHKCVECGKIVHTDKQQMGETLVKHGPEGCMGPFKRVYGLSGFILK